MFVYTAETGTYDAHGILGIYLTLDEAWDVAYAEDDHSASVTRYEVGTHKAETVKWVDYDSSARDFVVCTC